MTIFRCLEALEGTFIRIHMSQSCLGCIFEVFCVVGIKKCKYRPLNFDFTHVSGGERVRTQGQQGRFFDVGGLGGTFVRTHTRQSCLGCILEVL